MASVRYMVENGDLNSRYQFQYWALSLINALPSQDKKKGADSGVDGYINFYPDISAKIPAKIVISVKSGKIPSNHIRELEGLIKSPIVMAFLITLETPSRKMIADAAAAGYFTYPGGRQVPKIQIFTIEELLAGRKPEYYDYSEGMGMNKQAKKEVKKLKNQQFFLW